MNPFQSKSVDDVADVAAGGASVCATDASAPGNPGKSEIIVRP